MNEVSLKKQSDGLDIIEDLLKICNTFNDVPDKPALQNPKMNGKIIFIRLKTILCMCLSKIRKWVIYIYIYICNINNIFFIHE